MAKGYYSMQECADILGVTKQTIRNYIRRGLLPCYEFENQRKRINIDDFNEFMARRKGNNYKFIMNELEGKFIAQQYEQADLSTFDLYQLIQEVKASKNLYDGILETLTKAYYLGLKAGFTVGNNQRDIYKFYRSRYDSLKQTEDDLTKKRNCYIYQSGKWLYSFEDITGEVIEEELTQQEINDLDKNIATIQNEATLLLEIMQTCLNSNN